MPFDLTRQTGVQRLATALLARMSGHVSPGGLFLCRLSIGIRRQRLGFVKEHILLFRTASFALRTEQLAAIRLQTLFGQIPFGCHQTQLTTQRITLLLKFVSGIARGEQCFEFLSGNGDGRRHT
jgi:hypothetical protein